MGRRLGSRPAPDKHYTKVDIGDLIEQGYRLGEIYNDRADSIWVTSLGKAIKVRVYNDEYYYKELNPSQTKAGYMQIGLEKGKTIHVHTLVARAFIGPKPEGYEVDHIDFDKTNNTVKNLRYITIKENRGRSRKAETHTNYGRYHWKTQHYIKDDIVVSMTPEEYYDLLLETRGKGIANKIFKQAKDRLLRM